MIHDHEYSLLGGVNRALIGRYLTLLASAISGIAVFCCCQLKIWLKSMTCL